MVLPGSLLSAASASSAVMKSPEMNSPVPSMKKQRSASPSQAIPMSAFSAIALDDVAAIFFDQRIGFVVGKPSVDLKTQPRCPAGQVIEEPRRDQSAHAAAGIEDDVERFDHRSIDETEDV